MSAVDQEPEQAAPRLNTHKYTHTHTLKPGWSWGRASKQYLLWLIVKTLQNINRAVYPTQLTLIPDSLLKSLSFVSCCVKRCLDTFAINNLNAVYDKTLIFFASCTIADQLRRLHSLKFDFTPASDLA